MNSDLSFMTFHKEYTIWRLACQQILLCSIVLVIINIIMTGVFRARHLMDICLVYVAKGMKTLVSRPLRCLRPREDFQPEETIIEDIVLGGQRDHDKDHESVFLTSLVICP